MDDVLTGPAGDLQHETTLRQNTSKDRQDRLLVAVCGRGGSAHIRLAGDPAMSTAAPWKRQPRRAASIAPTSIFFMVIIASNARFASAPPAASASVSTRGVICQEMPHLSLHQPHSLS